MTTARGGGDQEPRRDDQDAGDDAAARSAEIDELAGRSWMALETAQSALRAATRYLDPEDVRKRTSRLAEQRSQTVDLLRGLARDQHTDGSLLHWLDVPTVSRRMLGLPNDVVACVFDLDSVLTTSASVHTAAWAETFDAFLLRRAARERGQFTPFDWDRDYEAYLAGRPRLDGVRAFLAGRGIRLPEGRPDDPADADTVHGLATRKNQALHRHLDREGVAAYVGSLCYLEAAHTLGLHRAVVSASANTEEILRRARLAHLIEQHIDGEAIEAERLQPKPAPDTLRAACRLLDVRAAEAADFETTAAGIQAARAAGFRLVVGVERGSTVGTLRAADPDIVITDLAQLLNHDTA